MSKLLTEPRIPKMFESKKRVKKPIKIKNETLPKVKYTILYESNKTKVDELFRIYKADPFKARVKYFNNPLGYNFTRLVLFEINETDFEICEFSVKFGISITNRIYSNQSKTNAISYRKGKFWHLTRRGPKSPLSIKPLLYAGLLEFIQLAERVNIYNYNFDNRVKSKVFNFFSERFFWFKTLSESEKNYGINLNVIKTKKLYGLNDLNRHIYKVPINIYKIIKDSNFINNHGVKEWIKVLGLLDNIQNLKIEMLDSGLFHDTTKMAKTLGRKINCNWGLKKLTSIHDSWSIEITNIVLDCELEYDLKIKPIYTSFAEFSGFKLLKTNKDMLREGMLQQHCVGTYINSVDKGDTAIYNVDGYTLQLKVNDFDKKSLLSIIQTEKERNPFLLVSIGGLNEKLINNIGENHKKVLVNTQFKGKFNSNPPNELIEMVDKKLVEFINADGFEKLEVSNKTDKVEESKDEIEELLRIEDDLF